MTFSSSNPSAALEPYRPWSDDYFARLALHVGELMTAKPLPDYEELDGHAFVAKRESQHHTTFTLRHPQRGLYALKVASAQAAPAVVQRLREEVSLLVGLSSTYHLVPYDVFDVAEVRSVGATFTYHVGTLEGRRGAGTLAAAEIAHYALQLSAQLADVHANGLLHLAIRPANAVFVYWPRETRIGQCNLHLANFDLRGIRIGDEVLPGIGPDAFCAPEQHRGDSVDERTDLWALGATLHFLCTGRPPSAENRSSLGEVYPQWLTRIITSCLSSAVADRPRSAVAVVDSLLAHVRVASNIPGAKIATFAAAGASESSAAVVIPDRFLLMSMNRLGRVPAVAPIEMKDLGWNTRLKEANRLYLAGTPSSIRRASAIMERMLGRWDEPLSFLGQLTRHPDAIEFVPYEPPPKRIGNEIWSTANLPMPRGALWAVMDLYSKSLIELFELNAQPGDLERLRVFCERWLATRSLGTPSRLGVSNEAYPLAESLTRMAQALAYLDKPEQARDAIETALRGPPTDIGTYFTAILLARDRGDYARASEHADAVEALMESTGDFTFYTKLHLLKAELAFRQGDYRLASACHDAILDDFDSPEIANLENQVACHVRNNASHDDVERSLAIALTSKTLEQWFVTADLAHMAGDRDAMQRAIDAIRADPRFNRPTDRWYHEAIARFEATRAKPL